MDKELRDSIVKAIDDFIADRDRLLDEIAGLKRTITSQDNTLRARLEKYNVLRDKLNKAEERTQEED